MSPPSSSFWPTLNTWHFYMLLHFYHMFFLSPIPIPPCPTSPPPLWLLLYFKGHVVRVSSPAAQGSVFSSSGCAMDGTTALTVQMNRVVATPPTLHSVSLWYLWPPSGHQVCSAVLLLTLHLEQQKQSLPGHVLIYLVNQKVEVEVLWMQNTVYESMPWCKI